MALQTFRSWGIARFARFPKMRRYYEARVIYGIGYAADKLAELATFAVGVRHVANCPDDAIPYHGRDRRLIRGPSESASSFRLRLFRAWDAWSQAGSVAGVVSQLQAYLGKTTDPVILESQDAGVPARSTWWSRFWVILPIGSHDYVGSIPADDQEALKRIIDQFRPADQICDQVVAIESGRLWGYPDDGYTWGDAVSDGLTWGDNVAHEFDVQGDPTA